MDKKTKRLKLSTEKIKEQNNIIDKFPSEVLEKIFSHLNIRELCQARQVCKKWHTVSQYPDFWKKVDVNFKAQELNQMDKRMKSFANMLLPHVTHLKLTFGNTEGWKLNFANFLKILERKCPLLKVLFFNHAPLMVEGKSSILDAAADFFPYIDALIMHDCILKCGQWICENDSHYHLKILDISNCQQNDVQDFLFYSGAMPFLKELHFAYESTYDFSNDPHIVSKLEIVDIEYNTACQSQFKALQKFGFNVTELYMCFSNIRDEDINFDNSIKGLKFLRIMCLRGCMLTFESINSIIDSCPFLQQVYVGDLCNNSNPIDYTKCNPKIVKTIYSSGKCKHYSKVDYMLEK